ncbi:MAG: glycosyltransferase family 2 protein [Cetobacterium sp.]|uniref:glycosyltransferase family 2 protein n=1 Tax=Cetobacterium sp. TaxID=2071632 RepID=UPI003F30C0FF
MNPKISIIVPVYKVEKYLAKCIDSILAQTFKNFEVILVNDGSPDRCGEICDEYAKKDNRIKVIHKENGGQASARNIGLDIAKGSYIGFLDSDDWIEPTMYEVLYELSINNNSEISIVGTRLISSKKDIQVDDFELVKIFTRERAMKEVLSGKYFNEVVWGKLFKKELFNDLKFKEKIKYEDTDFLYKVIDKANSLSYSSSKLYNYLIREGSTMDLAFKEISIDHIYIYDEMYKFYLDNYPKLKDIVLLRLLDNSLISLNKLILNNVDRKYDYKVFEIRKILNKYTFEILRIKKYNKNIKILLILLKLNINLYIKIIKSRNRCK